MPKRGFAQGVKRGKKSIAVYLNQGAPTSGRVFHVLPGATPDITSSTL